MPKRFILMIAVFLSGSIGCLYPHNQYESPKYLEHRQDCVPATWLKFKTTVDEAEKSHLIKIGPPDSQPIPFGGLNSTWVGFKSRIKAGDEIWFWDSRQEKNGYCIIRNGQVTDCVIAHIIEAIP